MRFLRYHPLSSLLLVFVCIGLFGELQTVVLAKSPITTKPPHQRPQAIVKKSKATQNAKLGRISPSDPGAGGALQSNKDAMAGAILMTLMERGTNKLFAAKNINFPSPLGGCIGLFFFLLLADMVSPGLGESIFKALSPGSDLLAKWFPVLFVPGLVMLPLAPSIGNSKEIFKFVMVTVIGFIYSLSTTAYVVLFLRAAQGTLVKGPHSTATAVETTVAPPTTVAVGNETKVEMKSPPSPPPVAVGNETKVEKKSPSPPPPPPPVPKAAPKPYPDETMTFLFRAAIVSGIASILATKSGKEYEQPIRTIFFFLTTFASYVWGARLPSGFTKAIHPLITSTAVTLSVIRLTGLATSTEFLDVLKTYKIGTLDLWKMGAADIMMFLLGPCVVSFAISMYSRRMLLKDNLFIVITSMLVSSIGGLFGTAAFVRAIQLGGNGDNGLMVRLSVLARNVTTALSMACTAILGGDISLAVTIVVLTGILGAQYGRRLLDAMGIYDPVTRGLAVGGSAQGLGVSSMVSEADAFPFAAMSMILTAISATVLVSIPAVKDCLVNLCKNQ